MMLMTMVKGRRDNTIITINHCESSESFGDKRLLAVTRSDHTETEYAMARNEVFLISDALLVCHWLFVFCKTDTRSERNEVR